MKNIDLYTWVTPNGSKASATLEELGLPYNVKPIDITTGIQKESEFVTINPNGRIPAIVDHDEGGLTIFESGAIMIYLAEKAGKLMPNDVKGRFNVMQWLMFQMGGIGPMQGQANVFYRYFPEKIPAAIERYQNETRRLYSVLDTQLVKNEYLAGDYSIADIANWSWVRVHNFAGVNLDEFENLYARIDKHLAGSQHIVGDSYSVADITAMCAIDFAEFVGIAVPAQLGNLTKWRDRVSSRASAQA